MKFLISSLFILFSFSQAFALDKKQEAGIHYQKALKWVEAKDFEAARKEAKQAAELDPSDPDNWLILGTVEQRLEHKPEAIEAFRKYLSLNPPEDGAQAVRTRIADLEVANEAQKKAENQDYRERFTDMNMFGVNFQFSPAYTAGAKSSSDLGASSVRRYALGFGNSYLMGDFAYINGGNAKNVTFIKSGGNVAAASASYGAVLFEFGGFIPVVDPFSTMGSFSFYVPVSGGMGMGFLDGSNMKASNFQADLAAGVGTRWYTKSLVIPQLDLIYHAGVESKFTSSDTGITDVQSKSGKSAYGGLYGLEVRLTLNFWFGGRNAAEKLQDQDLQLRLQHVQ